MPIASISPTARKPLDLFIHHGPESYSVFTKVVSIFKKSVKLTLKLIKNHEHLEEALVAIKCFKLIKGLMAFPKLCYNVYKIFKPEGNLRTKVITAVKIYKYSKNVVGLVKTVFYYLEKLHLISATAMAWTKITSWVFLPVSFMTTLVTSYKCGEKIKFMSDFRSNLKLVKHTESLTEPDINVRRVKLLLKELPKLHKFKVITKDCPIKDRLEGILVNLRSENAEIRKSAGQETKRIKDSFKQRISEHVGVAALDTALSAAGCVCTILSITCPPAAVGLVIAGLAMAVIGLGNFAYSKFIPHGDVVKDEKPMLYARVFKGARTTVKVTKAAFHNLFYKPPAPVKVAA